jgi:hypothetical protein
MRSTGQVSLWCFAEDDVQQDVAMEQWFVNKLLDGESFVEMSFEMVKSQFASKGTLQGMKRIVEPQGPLDVTYSQDDWLAKESFEIALRPKKNLDEQPLELQRFAGKMARMRKCLSALDCRLMSQGKWEYKHCWDYVMIAKLQTLIRLAQTHNLSFEHQTFLEQYVPDFVYFIQPSLTAMVKIASTDLTTAAILLKSLLQTSKVEYYLEAICHLPITFRTLTMVQRLLEQNVSLQSPTFLGRFTSVVAQSCDKQDSRMVKMACGFFENLLQMGILQRQRDFVELDHFCLQNSRIKEASDLYRNLKNR